MVLPSLITPGCGVLSENHNPYSKSHNVWTYIFGKKNYEDEYNIKEEDPSQLDLEYVKLSYFDYPNSNLPTIIVSQQLTTFLKSLTDTEYRIAIKPILIQATTLVPEPCLYEESCDEKFIEYITTDDFIIAIKDILTKIISIVQKSIYLDIFLQKYKYLWYNMYWSLDTTIDNPPIITYNDFNQAYRMCFFGVPLDSVIDVRDTMKYMLEQGYNETTTQYLNQIAKPWLDCIDREYQHSVSILKGNNTSWVNAFLYNLTTYTKATTMMEYILNNIQDINYELATPHKIKRILDYNNEEWLFKPMIYSLYLPTFLEPYIAYMQLIMADRYLFVTDPDLANFTLDTTAFGEKVPLDNTSDHAATNFIAYQNSKIISIHDNKNNTNRLSKFVKFVTKALIKGYVMIHYPVFRMMYQGYNLVTSVYDMMFSESEDVLMAYNTLEKRMAMKIMFNVFMPNKTMAPSEHHSLQITDCKKVPPITNNYFHYSGLRRNNIDYLRRIAPKIFETTNLLKNINVAINQKSVDYDLLDDQCKTFIGTLPIQSDTLMADCLAQVIKLYFVLRYLRPYDFYAEEQDIVVFIKTTYSLQRIQHFTYFQSYMLLYSQFIIAILANPGFKYTLINADQSKIKIQVSTLKCQFTFVKNDMVSLIIGMRTMWSGKRLLNQYSGESGIIHNAYMASIAAKNLNNKALQTVYWRYRGKKHINIIQYSTEKLYAALQNPYFRIYAFLQDPVILAKIIDDLLVKIKNRS